MIRLLTSESGEQAIRAIRLTVLLVAIASSATAAAAAKTSGAAMGPTTCPQAVGLWTSEIGAGLATAVASGLSPAQYAQRDSCFESVCAYDEWTSGCFVAYGIKGGYAFVVFSAAAGSGVSLPPRLAAAGFTSELTNGDATEVRACAKYGEAGWELWQETLQALAEYYAQVDLQPRDDPYDIDCVGQLSDESLLYLLGTWGMWGSGTYFSRGEPFLALAGEDASGRILVSDWVNRRIGPLGDDMAQFLSAFQASSSESERDRILKDNRGVVGSFLRSWLPESAGITWDADDAKPSFGDVVAEFPLRFIGAEVLFEFWRWVAGGPVAINDVEVCERSVASCWIGIVL